MQKRNPHRAHWGWRDVRPATRGGRIPPMERGTLADLLALAAFCLTVPLRAQPSTTPVDVERVVASPPEDLSDYVPGAARLEGRLLAPCCWIQTLDVHGSEVAVGLRTEIRHRLRAGESAGAIEA